MTLIETTEQANVVIQKESSKKPKAFKENGKDANQRLPEQLMNEWPNPKFAIAPVAKRVFVRTIGMKIYVTCTVIRMKIK